MSIDNSANILTNGVVSILRGTPVPAGGTNDIGYSFSNVANFGIFFGSGVPTLQAGTGSLYLRSDAVTATTRLYINTNGLTTWTSFTTLI